MRGRARLLTVLLVGTMSAAVITGCGSDDKKPITSSGESITQEAAAETADADEGEETAAPEEAPVSSNDTSIEEQVILDHDGVKVTAEEYVDDDIWGDGIKLLIENDGSQSVGISSTATIVNDYMITDLLSETVAPGKKAYETMYLASNQLRAAGIENIGQIEMYLHLFNPDTYETTYEADPVTIKTNKFDVMDTKPNDDGQELYNDNGIRIVGKYVDEDTIWGNAIVLYLENNTDRKVTVQCEELSVNGFMITPLFSSELYPGKMAVDDITILSSELEENNITSVDDVELTFHMFDSDSYETILDTNPITFSTK